MQYLTKTSLIPFALGVLVSGVLFFFICRDQGSTPASSVDDVLITNQRAINMINNYDPCDDIDTTTISGHLELGALLSYIDLMSRRCDTIGLELSGLEYYFAKYVGEYENRRTIVIYPTLKDSIGPKEVHHIPFDPFLSSSTDTVTVVEMNNSVRTSRINDSRYVLDRSNMSPPRKPTF